MSRLCRLRTKTHGDDGQWAYNEIIRLRDALAEASSALANVILAHGYESGTPVDALKRCKEVINGII